MTATAEFLTQIVGLAKEAVTSYEKQNMHTEMRTQYAYTTLRQALVSYTLTQPNEIFAPMRDLLKSLDNFTDGVPNG